MGINNINNLLTQLGLFLEKYYFTAIIVATILGIIIVALIIRHRFAKKNPITGEKSLSLLQFILESNPGILGKMIAENAKNKKKISKEIGKFNKIKQIKKASPTTIELLVETSDSSDHWYRAETTADSHKPRILSLSKFT